MSSVRVMFKLFCVVLVIGISGCSLIPDKAYQTANVVSLFEQANINHDEVTKILFSNVDKFSTEELAVLEESYVQVESNREALSFSLKSGVIDTLVASGEAIKKYHHIRTYYSDAIMVVEGKLSKFPLRDRIKVGRQIDVVTRLDAEIGRLLSSPDGADQREGVNSMISLLTLFAKILIAMGV